MKVGVTGHRPDKLWGYNMYHICYRKLQKIFEQKLVQLQCDEAWSGMALGTDMIFCKAVLSLKEQGYNIRLCAAIPHEGHGAKWLPDSVAEYKQILAKCDQRVVVTPGPYASWKMDTRNRYIVDSVDRMIAVYTGQPSGTANCVQYAYDTNVPVDIITPDDVLLAEVYV